MIFLILVLQSKLGDAWIYNLIVPIIANKHNVFKAQLNNVIGVNFIQNVRILIVQISMLLMTFKLHSNAQLP